jgi:F-type H+-transporting ATPase subunit delta|tara:strand:+ start:206 stop:742 length:537 start_codon:yes stop_codon:yes gene_type:complete
MLEKATITRPYAEAAFAQALEENKLAEWSEMLSLLAVIISNQDMRKLINNPKLSANKLYDLILDIYEENLSKTSKNFIKILIDAKRIELASEISAIFEEKRLAEESVTKINVTTAYPLNENQIKVINDLFSKRTGNKIDINVDEDKDLIGGVIIRTGDSVIDASLRGRLKELNNVIAQ